MYDKTRPDNTDIVCSFFITRLLCFALAIWLSKECDHKKKKENDKASSGEIKQIGFHYSGFITSTILSTSTHWLWSLGDIVKEVLSLHCPGFCGVYCIVKGCVVETPIHSLPT